ncbi:MAG: hypothetical protein BIP78_0313 [Candidatus Bipolaricaulis sibiricus]|uniref:Uncharacterized protein n=1 Tax=Bipolaricaulis sibiricus TaxID=2501609 RepID=A0A410FS94_BIPS1|nr:MAG: hypothetical protein BIP78_0313 [Candidatus Bipolaricaulis sibiricus]
MGSRQFHSPGLSSVAQVITLDRSVLTARGRELSPEQVELILAGLDIVLGR